MLGSSNQNKESFSRGLYPRVRIWISRIVLGKRKKALTNVSAVPFGFDQHTFKKQWPPRKEAFFAFHLSCAGKAQSHQLPWTKRFDLIQGIARGLLYLHRDSCLRVIHRDLKASNVLLDEISDFGLARTFQVTQELVNTNRIVGTFGYMSPEYAMGGLFSEKSDVYSFGLLLLEIVSGMRNSGFYDHERHLNLLSYDHAADRPSIPSVVLMLSNETNLPQPKKPTFIFQRWLNSDTQSQINKHQSVNDIAVSVVEG
ncbi:hypothetical protein HAX54_009382 [Datura stramonium]|uniref:Protein kinase domain-containing protein n=1 Tax=Datura stramonium TaxID=4076 RepID=A0ABS8RWS4_DATST|nr:hypothetical protein [Datura stramonium]